MTISITDALATFKRFLKKVNLLNPQGMYVELVKAF